MSRPSDNMMPSGKRRPGQQITKDDYEDDEDGPEVEPGTWGKADAATMSRRKVIKVRRGAATPTPTADQPPAAADTAGNPFAGVSLAAPAAQSTNPFAGVSLAAVAAAGQAQAPPADASKAAAEAAPAPAADTDNQPDKKPDTQDKAEGGANASAATPAAAASPADKQPAAEAEQQDGSKPDKADDKAAAVAADKAATGTSGGFGGFAAAGTGTFGGFGGLGATTGGFGGFGSGTGFGGLAAAAKDGSGASGSLFAGFTAPQPSTFGGFGSGSLSSSKAKNVEEGGGDGENGAEENGQELFGGQEVAPVVQLSEVPKQTGEEEENSVFTADGKLYEFVDGNWKERGRGDLRLNVHRSTHRARLVMRQKGSQRLLLNANLYPKMPTEKMMGGKGATFAAVNAAPAGGGESGVKGEKDGQEAAAAAEAAPAAGAAAPCMRTFAFKAKGTAEIDQFLAAMDKYKAGSGADAGGEQPANPDAW